MEDDRVRFPQVSIGPTAKAELLMCDACDALVSERAEACPACGHKIDAETIARMRVKTIRRKEEAARLKDQGLTAVACLLLCCIPVMICIAIASNAPNTTDSNRTSAPRPYESEDDYVRRRALQYMTPAEYDAAKKENERMRSIGVSDEEQLKHINAELHRRFQLD